MEYEYSFNVKDINEYIDYCKNHNFKMISNSRQIRTIYRNKNLMARITQDINKNKKVYTLDFKENKSSKKDLTIRKESKRIEFDDISNCKDILKFLDYKKDNTLDRIRYVYKKRNVQFEIDIYNKPTKAYVVAIEGEKKDADKVYNDINYLNEKYKI